MDNTTASGHEADYSSQPSEAEVSFTQLPDYLTVLLLWRVWPPLLLLLGTFGNIATICVMRRLKDHNSSQHVLLMSLAMSDLGLLYTGTLREWLRHVSAVDVQALHTVSCKVHSWLLYSANVVSAWLVTSVTVQRTVAVLWPHRVRALCTVRNTWGVVGAVVTAALALNCHFLVGIVLPEDHTHCTLGTASYAQFYQRVFTWVDMAVSSLVPAVTQLVCDVILSSTLLQATSASSVSAAGSLDRGAVQGTDRRRKRASRTTGLVLALSCMFLLLTMPVCLCLLWYNHVDNSQGQGPEFTARKELMYGVTFLLWYTNSAINFLLYCVTGTRFRQQFISLLCCGAQRLSAITGVEAMTGPAVKGTQK